MNRKEALTRACQTLTAGGVAGARLEGEVLLRHVLGIDRARLYADLHAEMLPAEEERLASLLERCRLGEPLAYITGHREFFGLDFLVGPQVLIPRPETELLVEKALEQIRRRGLDVVADIGTGCGAIAVSLAVNVSGLRVYATDISRDALEIARQNCLRHGVGDRVMLRQGDMLDPLPFLPYLVVANLPYVRTNEIIGPLRYEPRLALDGGRDGLDAIRKFCRQLRQMAGRGGLVFMEIGEGQAGEVVDIVRRRLPQAGIEVTPDLSGIDRMVSISLTPGHL